MDPKKDEKECRIDSGVYYEVVNTVQHSEPLNIFVICFDREGSEHNVIDRPFALGLARALLKADQLAKEGRIDMVVMCSAKSTSFVAGADIKHELQLIGIRGSISAYSDCTSLQVILAFLQSLPVPTIAVVAGTALGGGMELMLAADYRIVDPVACKQIGLPEVKLGVLPGVGGAVWLPRMIGFRRSLPLLLTGSPITPPTAHSLGVVDCLLDDAGTVAVTEPCLSEACSVDKARDGKKSKKAFDYRWVPGVTRFVEENVVLKSMTAQDGKEKERGYNCEECTYHPIEEIVEEMAGNWERSEVKFAKRFPQKRGFRLIADYLYNVVVYLLTLIQLWWKLGRSMPAPFVILQTAFASLYIGSHKEALSLSARNFAQLATSAESTSIMGLFLVTRALRKYALNYGLRETLRVFEKEKLRIFVVMSQSDRKFGTALVQGLLYAGVNVTAILVDEEQKRKTGIEGSVSKVRERVRKLFDYAMKRGHLKHKEVDEKMKRLDIYETDWEEKIGELAFVKTVVINASLTGDTTTGDTLEKLQRQSSELVVMEPAPGRVAPLSLSHSTVLVNWGDPVRKKTLSVELSPANDRVPHSCIRIAAQVVSSLGKIPVFTPSSVSFAGSIAHYVALHHWALAVRLTSKGLSEGEVDSYARKAGYTKGPLATMKQLDKVYLSHLLQFSDKLSLLSDAASMLRAYLTNSLTVTRACKQGKPSADDVSILFYATNMKASIQARSMNEIPEYAIDFLCVSGLVSFPPTEGGPLNYLARNGKESIIRRLQKVAGNHCLKDEVQRLDMEKVVDNVHELFEVSSAMKHNANVHDLGKAEAVSDVDIESKRSCTGSIINRADRNLGGGEGVQSDGVGSSYCSVVTVLSAAQLEKVGPTHGLDNVELLLFPLPMLLALLAVGLLLLTVITCWAL